MKTVSMDRIHSAANVILWEHSYDTVKKLRQKKKTFFLPNVVSS